MKKQILKQLKAIEKAATLTGMKGSVSLSFSGVSVEEWETVLESITEFSRYKHIISIGAVQVYLLLD